MEEHAAVCGEVLLRPGREVLSCRHLEHLLRPEDVAAMDDLAGSHLDDRDRHPKRVVRRSQVVDLLEPADERLGIAAPDTDVDLAGEAGAIEPPPCLREECDVRGPAAPTGRGGRVEADVVHDRLHAVDVRVDLSALPKRVHDQAPPVDREDELAEVDVPFPRQVHPTGWPARTTSPGSTIVSMWP